MKRNLSWILALVLTSTISFGLLAGCSKPDRLDPRQPVTLTLWHVFGSQTASPMNDKVSEFNATVGKEKGVVINVTSVSNSSDIHDALVPAARGDAGAGQLPDLFFCYPETVQTIGSDRLDGWQNLFSNDELSSYVSSFLEEGTVDGKLLVFPVAKSSEALFINKTIFDRFFADTGHVYEKLATWEGLFEVAASYYEWSGGKSFVMHDELLNFCQINTTALGGNAYVDGQLQMDDPVFKKQWDMLAEAAVQGFLHVEDNYETVCMMTGEIIAGIGSTASIMYFQDTVTYPDNTKEPLELAVLPCPVPQDGQKLAMQQGTGLAASVKGDKKKEAAALLFASWLTSGGTNLDFVVQSGYMPVQKEAFGAIGEYAFPSQAYRELYEAFDIMYNEYGFFLPPVVDGYYGILWSFFENSLEILTSSRQQYLDGQGQLEEIVADSFTAMHQAMSP